MAAQIATFNVDLLARIGDNEPINIGTISIPIHLAFDPTQRDPATGTLTTPHVGPALANALREAADTLT